MHADNLQQVADFFGYKVETIKKWSQHGAPLHNPPYDLNKVQEWRLNRSRRKPVEDDVEIHDEINSLRKQKLEAKIAFKKSQEKLNTYRLAVESGKLIKFEAFGLSKKPKTSTLNLPSELLDSIASKAKAKGIAIEDFLSTL